MAKDDGYIRIRCKECGKKLKAKKSYAGQMFTCKVCKTVNVLPFVDGEGHAADGETPQAIGSDGTPIESVPGDKWTPDFKTSGLRIAALDDLVHALLRCQQDAFVRAQNVLTNADLSGDEQKMELFRIRRDREAKEKDLIERTRKELRDTVTRLREHPMAKSVAIREQLQEAVRQYSAFVNFMECLFE